MKSVQAAVLAGCLVMVGACAGPLAEPVLSVSPDRASFDGRTERVILKIHAWEAGEKLGGGVVRLTAPVGEFIGGSELILSDGFVTATYACSPADEPACVGSIRISAEWAGMHATTQVIGVERVPPESVKWEVVPTGVSAALLAIASAKDGTAWAVGEHGVVLHLVGRTWTKVPTGVGSTLRGVAMGPADEPIVVGDDGVMLRWQGDHFSLLVQEGDDLTAVATGNDGVVHVGGASGLLYEFVGDRLDPALDLRTPVLSIAPQGADVWATGEGLLTRFSAGQWLSMPVPVSGKLSFAQTGRDALWLVGERTGATSVSGLLVSGPMPNWRTTALPEPVRAIAEVPGVAERFALTSAHLYRQLDDGHWDAVECPSPASAITSRADGDLVLIGPSGISLLRTH
jgi:hypothetical protein